MIVMNQVVEIRTRDLATLPSVELRTKLEEGAFELSIMSNACHCRTRHFTAFGGSVIDFPFRLPN
jgi:hypothetical protein